MNRACEQPLISIQDRFAGSFLTSLFLCLIIACFWPGKTVVAQNKNPFLDQTIGFSKKWNYTFVAEVLSQLRFDSREKGDMELYALLQNTRIVVPNKSLKEAFPNAYALADEQANWVVIEERWMNQVAGFADLGALYSLPVLGTNYATFANKTFYKFCRQFQDTYRVSLRENVHKTPVYMFKFEDYLNRSDPKWGVDYLMFDKLTGLVFVNTIVWTFLHEVGHHALGHTKAVAGNYHTNRQQELDADAWAFSRMKALEYSLFGVGSYMVARSMTEACLEELELLGHEEDSSHPKWLNRDIALRRDFDVLAAPMQDPRIFHIPMGIPEPVLTTITIPDSMSDVLEASILQKGNMSIGMVEWDNNTVRVYRRESTGGRIEYIIKDQMQKMQLIEQRQYDTQNRLVNTIELPAIQVDVAIFDFLIIEGMKIADIKNRHGGRHKLIVIHLRRVGISDSAIQQVLAAVDQYLEDRRYFGLQYAKGIIGFSTLSEKVREKATSYEQHLIGILGESLYIAFTESYSNEIEQFSPPSTGIDIWEEKIFNDNTN
ncbi:MAG: hypothetical protein H8E26_11370 [FCB group bacterium]|nr:hypothetical protein [FCB group bacterium]MBL7029220.1 hypothetical protein [Candidatus Neomarinimicrobiota bacterium]MBL7121134.1 hypothetical protein [Candidatus Neomarinimicrobiota bacterium]